MFGLFITGQLTITNQNVWGFQGFKFLGAYYLLQGTGWDDCHVMERVLPKSANQLPDTGLTVLSFSFWLLFTRNTLLENGNWRDEQMVWKFWMFHSEHLKRNTRNSCINLTFKWNYWIFSLNVSTKFWHSHTDHFLNWVFSNSRNFVIWHKHLYWFDCFTVTSNCIATQIIHCPVSHFQCQSQSSRLNLGS